MAALLLDRGFFSFVRRLLKKKQRNENRRNTEKMDPYRNTVHLEDKREEFENRYKLER